MAPQRFRQGASDLGSGRFKNEPTRTLCLGVTRCLKADDETIGPIGTHGLFAIVIPRPRPNILKIFSVTLNH